MDFHNFYSIHVFKVMESIADIPIELPCLSDLENPSPLPVREVLMILYVIIFWNFHAIHVFEIKESIPDISTKLPCLGDIKNPTRLPVQKVLGGTGECVL